MQLESIVQTLNQRIEPIREAVEKVQSKTEVLRETEASLPRVQDELERARLAVEEAEVSAAMQPGPGTAKVLNLARSQHKSAQEALDFANARVRGFRAAIDADMAELASMCQVVAVAKSEFHTAIVDAYLPVFEEAWKVFHRVLGDGLVLARASGADYLGRGLLKNEIHHPRQNNTWLFGDHESQVNRAMEASPNRQAIEASLSPVVMELSQIERSMQTAVQRTKEVSARESQRQGTAAVPFVTVSETMDEFRERQNREAAHREANRFKGRKPASNPVQVTQPGSWPSITIDDNVA